MLFNLRHYPVLELIKMKLVLILAGIFNLLPEEICDQTLVLLSLSKWNNFLIPGNTGEGDNLYQDEEDVTVQVSVFSLSVCIKLALPQTAWLSRIGKSVVLHLRKGPELRMHY